MDNEIKLITDHGWVLACLLFVLKETYAMIKGDAKRMRDTLEEVRISLAKIDIHISYLQKNEARQAKSETDLDRAWEEIRTIKKERLNN